jgi:hypothetical protein
MIAAIIIDGFAYYIEIVVRRDGQEPGSGKEVNFCLGAVSTATSLTENPKAAAAYPCAKHFGCLVVFNSRKHNFNLTSC